MFLRVGCFRGLDNKTSSKNTFRASLLYYTSEQSNARLIDVMRQLSNQTLPRNCLNPNRISYLYLVSQYMSGQQDVSWRKLLMNKVRARFQGSILLGHRTFPRGSRWANPYKRRTGPGDYANLSSMNGELLYAARRAS